MEVVRLHNGVKMPTLGLGMFQMHGRQTVSYCVDAALQHGYRLFDTASVYRNEEDLGNCIPSLLVKHDLNREDVFITTKLGPKDHGRERAKASVETSLAKLNVTYIDLFLIHWPGKQGLKSNDPQNAQLRKETWEVLEGIYQESDKIRAIGVSNYTCRHMNELLSHCVVNPMVLQSEFHPDFQQTDGVLELCEKNNIHIQSYSTLGRNKLVNDERFTKIASQHQKTVPQVLLRWAIQRRCSVIPKSCKTERIQENSKIFDFVLSDAEVKTINRCSKDVKYAWDPSNVS